MSGDLVEQVRLARAQLEILEAVLSATDRRREVFDLVENAADTNDAADQLAALLGVSRDGAVAVLDMQLRRLTVTERERIRTWVDDQRRTLESLTR